MVSEINFLKPLEAVFFVCEFFVFFYHAFVVVDHKDSTGDCVDDDLEKDC